MRINKSGWHTILYFLIVSGIAFLNNKTLKCQEQSTDDFFVTYGYQVTKEIQLPKTLVETSGLLLLDTFLLSFNDSGNEPVLYAISPSSGVVFYEWSLSNAENTDWEDIAQDADYIYIGDFGNNFGKRKDLVIYRVSKDTLMQLNNQPLWAEKIGFSFEDQTSFFPSFYNHSFDCEAVISFNDSLIIFSKDWARKITTAYIIPKKPGNYTAKIKDSFDVSSFISGADYSLRDSLLVLTGYIEGKAVIWSFTGVSEQHLFGQQQKKHELINLPGIQNEGIAIIRPGKVYLSAEGSQGAARLYHLKLNQ